MTIEEIEEKLLIISEKSNNERSSIDAFTAIYREYSKFVYSVVSVNLKNVGLYDVDVVEAIVNDTFYILYEKPLDFNFPKDAVNDGNFKAWLSVVAKNELLRLLKKSTNKMASLELLQIDPFIESEEIEEELYESVNVQIMNNALNSLPERDREILRAIYMHYEKGKNTPSDVLDELCERYKTTKDNIRQIKSRSEKKIIEYFSKESQLKPLKNGK